MFGPDLVVLDPHENLLSLSGKRRRGEKGGREKGRGEGGEKGEG